MPVSTVSGILTRIGLGKLSRLEPPEPPNRYERAAGRARPHRRQEARPDRTAPGIASPARGIRRRPRPARPRPSAGSTCTSASMTPPASPTSRSSTTRRPPPRSPSCAAPSRSTPPTASRVERVMTDNGSAYISTLHALACRALGLKHLRTRPYRPRTNGKAERFIRTMLRGWAYGAIYRNSHERTARTRRLARLLQSPTTTRQPQPPSPHRAPTRAQPEQRPGSYI